MVTGKTELDFGLHSEVKWNPTNFDNMSEQEQKFFSETTARVIDAISHLRPQSEEGKIVSSPTCSFWREPPFFHEQVIISSWAYFVEKYSQKALTREDIDDYFVILDWVCSLKLDQVFKEISPRRKALPSCLLEQGKGLMKYQLAYWEKSKNDSGNEGFMKKWALGIARNHAQSLNPIFPLSLFEEEKQISNPKNH